jgi:hypothetical protein
VFWSLSSSTEVKVSCTEYRQAIPRLLILSDTLKALRVIEGTPEPTPLEERDVANLNPEEMRELIRHQKTDHSTQLDCEPRD